jgi:hypothetical protein
VCAWPIADRTPVVIARPSLGRLDFAALGWVPLDRDLLIGRDPGAQPPDGPRPVVIDHPSLSQKHIEVRLHDWIPLLIDLGSEHGTTVVLPGRPAQQLRAQQPEPLVPGTVIWLGQQVACTYLPY